MQNIDVIVIGSGIGGLSVALLLASYGKRFLVCKNYTIPGGTAHSFQRWGFKLDFDPSFYCGCTGSQILNPLKQILDVIGESLQVILYSPLGDYHFPEGTFCSL